MKTLSVLTGFMLVVVISFAQNPKNSSENNVKFTNIENALNLQNASSNLLIENYLMEKVSYPYYAQKCGSQGTEVVQFTVDKSGKISEITIINSVCRAIDEEIIWALKKTNGMWIPEQENGKPVAKTMELSLVFNIPAYPGQSAKELFTQKALDCFNDGNISLYKKNNPKKALKSYSLGLNYLPHDKNLLLLRGMCRYELGDTEGALNDWQRMKNLGGIDMSEVTAQIENMKGFNDLICLLNN